MIKEYYDINVIYENCSLIQLCVDYPILLLYSVCIKCVICNYVLKGNIFTRLL